MHLLEVRLLIPGGQCTKELHGFSLPFPGGIPVRFALNHSRAEVPLREAAAYVEVHV
jgi:hypothetical protein